MMFSRTAIHGIYSLCYLNRSKGDGAVSSASVSAALGAPVQQTCKVLQSLCGAGLVRSVRGRGGGYVIAKRLDKIRLIDVLDALNPPENEETLRPRSCRGARSARMCSAHRGLLKLNDRVREALGAQTLGALVGSVCTDAEDSHYSSRWTRVEKMSGEVVVLS